jgi:hypothetical protein
MIPNDLAKYNGWSNYPTWAVWCWLGDDAGPPQAGLSWGSVLLWAHKALELERKASPAPHDPRPCRQRAVSRLAERLRGAVELHYGHYLNLRLHGDLLTFAFRFVDWAAIAAGLMDTAEPPLPGPDPEATP